MYNQVAYYAHLYNSLIYNKRNSLEQKENLGEWIEKIAGYNYEASIEKWYSKIFDLISSMPPEFYVEVLTVYETDFETVQSISYTYYNKTVQKEDIKNIRIIMIRRSDE